KEVNLNIRARQSRTGREERARCARRDGERASSKRRVAHASHYPAQGMIDGVIQRDGLRATRDDADLHMILQVVADTGRVEHHVDAVLPEEIGGADAGELQELRRIVSAA